MISIAVERNASVTRAHAELGEEVGHVRVVRDHLLGFVGDEPVEERQHAEADRPPDQCPTLQPHGESERTRQRGRRFPAAGALCDQPPPKSRRSCNMRAPITEAAVAASGSISTHQRSSA
jgi:hypothetical protein